jgi:hypothetical protein
MRKLLLVNTSFALVLAAAIGCTTTSTTTENEGGSGTGGDGTTSSTTATSTTTTTNATTTTTGAGGEGGAGAGGTGGAGAGGTGGAGGGDGCTAISIADLAGIGFDQSQGYVYEGVISPDVDGTAGEDGFLMSFYAELTGAVDLGSTVNSDYSTCEACLLAFTGYDEADPSTTTLYFQSEGTLDLGSSTLFYIAGTIDGTTLVELDANGDPVAGGKCLSIAGQSFMIEPPTPGWTECPPDWYGDGEFCDCECGAFDTDCENAANEVFGCETGEVCNMNGVCELPG